MGCVGGLERVWGQDTDERLRECQEQFGPVDLDGKVVWDAGCGPGLLADAITTLGCQVVATDISDSVFTAAKRFAANPRLRFVQADLARPLFPPATFDLIHCAGVLHHTPNTRETLEAVLPALKPSGTIFVWLYWKVPGWKFKLRSVIRRAVVPLPLAVRRAVSYAYVPVVALGGRGGASFRRGDASLRELAVVQLDYFTPKYRHEHTPAEVHGWFRDLGLTEVATSWEGVNGFGVRGTRLRRRKAARSPRSRPPPPRLLTGPALGELGRGPQLLRVHPRALSIAGSRSLASPIARLGTAISRGSPSGRPPSGSDFDARRVFTTERSRRLDNFDGRFTAGARAVARSTAARRARERRSWIGDGLSFERRSSARCLGSARA